MPTMHSWQAHGHHMRDGSHEALTVAVLNCSRVGSAREIVLPVPSGSTLRTSTLLLSIIAENLRTAGVVAQLGAVEVEDKSIRNSSAAKQSNTRKSPPPKRVVSSTPDLAVWLGLRCSPDTL